MELHADSTQDLWAQPPTIKSFMSLSMTVFPTLLSQVGNPVLAIVPPGWFVPVSGGAYTVTW